MPLGGTLYTGEDQWNELVGVAQAPVAVQTTQPAPAPAPAAAAPPPVTDSQGYAAEQPYAPVEGGVNYGSQAQPATLPAAQPVAESYYVEPTSDAAQGYAPAGVMEVGMVADKYFAGYPTPTKSAQYGQYSGGTHVGVPGAAAEPRIEGPGNNFDLAETVIQPAAEAAFGTPATYQGIPNYQEPYNPNASMYYGGQSTERATPVIHPDRFGASGYADYGTGANAAQTAGSPYTSSGSAMYGQGAVDAYNGGYPVVAGTQSMGYTPDIEADALAAYEEPNRQSEWEAIARGAPPVAEQPIMDVVGPDLQRGWDTVSQVFSQPDPTVTVQGPGDRANEWRSRGRGAVTQEQPIMDVVGPDLQRGWDTISGLITQPEAVTQDGEPLTPTTADTATAGGTSTGNPLEDLINAGWRGLQGAGVPVQDFYEEPTPTKGSPGTVTPATETAPEKVQGGGTGQTQNYLLDPNGTLVPLQNAAGTKAAAAYGGGTKLQPIRVLREGEDGKTRIAEGMANEENFAHASDTAINGKTGVQYLSDAEFDALKAAGKVDESWREELTSMSSLVPVEWAEIIEGAEEGERDTHLGTTDGAGTKGTKGTGVDTNVGATATATSSGTGGGGRSDGGTYRGGYSGGGGRGYGGGGGGGYYDDGGGGGGSPFDNPIFDRFLETVGRSNPEWLSSMMEMFGGRSGGFSRMGSGSSSRMGRRGSKSRSRSRMGRKGSPSKTSTSSSGNENFPARKRSRASSNGKTVTSN